MKKYLLILFTLTPLFLIGQDYVWTGDMSSTGELIDSISGSAIPNYEYIGDVDTTLGYLPTNKGIILVHDGDSVEINRLFSNYDFDSIKYFRIEDRVLNSNLTLDKPRRLSRIEIYNTATTPPIWADVFNPNALRVDGIQYTTLNSAVGAAISGDTIYRYSGVDGTAYYDNKGLTLIGVGNSIISRDINYPVRFVSSGTVKNMKIKRIGSYSVYSNSDANFVLENCVLETTGNNLGNFNTLNKPTLINNHFKAYVYSVGDSLVAEGNFFDGGLTNNALHLSGVVTSKYNVFVNGNASFLSIDINLTEFTSLCDSLNGLIIGNNAYNADVDMYFNYGLLSNNQNTSSIILTNSNSANVRCTFSGCNFYNNYDGRSTLINTGDMEYLEVRDSYFYDVYGVAIRSVDHSIQGHSAYVYNNKFYSDSVQGIALYECNSLVDNNYMDSYSNLSYIAISTTSVIEIQSQIKNNTIISRDITKDENAAITFGLNTDTVGSGMIINGLIENNTMLGPGYYGNDYEGLHGCFIANQSCDVRYNYSSGYLLGFLTKKCGGDLDLIIPDLNVEFSYNISVENGANYLAKCAPNTKFINNTGYNSTIDNINSVNLLIQPAEAYPSSTNSDSCVMYNNIFYNSDIENQGNIKYLYPLDTVGVKSDNNITYNKYNPDKNILVNGVKYNLTEWQGLGYDQNSYNTDPNFKSSTELWPVSPSDAIGNGLNLGSEYNQGLNISSVWPDNVVLKTQPEEWIIGAYTVDDENNVLQYYNSYLEYTKTFIIFK